METGLYGQHERGEHFAVVADDNRAADVVSEGDTVYEGIPTEEKYRRMMADCLIRVILGDRTIDAKCKKSKDDPEWVAEGLEELIESLANSMMDGIALEVALRSIGLTREQQHQALVDMGAIEEEMRVNGFSNPIRQRTMSMALPIAYQIIREQHLDKHANANRPQSHVGKRVYAYTPKNAAKFADPDAIAALMW